jgi:uncharacterized protein (TIGR02246 family)
MTRLFVIILLGFAAGPVPTGTPLQTPPKAEKSVEQAIRQLINGYSSAFNKGDGDALPLFWTEDADYVDVDGKATKGRAQLSALLKERAKTLQGYRLTCQITSLRLVGRDAAVLDGKAELIAPAGGTSHRRYTAVLTRANEKWLIAAARDTSGDDAAPPDSELRQLDWLIGNWTRTVDAGSVQVSCRLAMNDRFLLLEYVATGSGKDALTMTERIGWDPAAGHLRSWFFDSQGGIGEGRWVREGNTWTVEVAGVLGDGRTAASINRWELTGNGEFLWSSRERHVGGERVPDVEYRFRRKSTDDLVEMTWARVDQLPARSGPPPGARPGFVPHPPPPVHTPPAVLSGPPIVHTAPPVHNAPRVLHPTIPTVRPVSPPATVSTPNLAPHVGPVTVGHGLTTVAALPVRPIYSWGNRPTGHLPPTYHPVYAYHQAWHHGYWTYWPTHPVVWFGGGVAFGWLLGGGETIIYQNPYYVAIPAVIPVFDYSQPLPVASPPVPAVGVVSPAPTQLPAPDDVRRTFETARAAFRAGDYAKALTLADTAVAQLSTDAVLHEFRALCLFAMQNYRDAAAVLYAVLAAGPGWDWETMKSFYPDVAPYTAHLRALEAYQRANPTAPEASFVLGYHYLCLGYPQDAAKQFEIVVKLRPDDRLAAQLLKALTQRRTDQPAPGRS